MNRLWRRTILFGPLAPPVQVTMMVRRYGEFDTEVSWVTYVPQLYATLLIVRVCAADVHHRCLVNGNTV